MDDLERDLYANRYLKNFRMYAEVNGRAIEVLYNSQYFGDPLPWAAAMDPAVRFPSTQVRPYIVTCKACGTEVGNGYRYRADKDAMDLCERDAVRELAGDLVQIEKGTMK
jgi:hypothetical protein